MGRGPARKGRGRPPKAGGGGSAAPSRATSPCPEEPLPSNPVPVKGGRPRSNSLQPPDTTAASAPFEVGTWAGRGKRAPSPSPFHRPRARTPQPYNDPPDFFFNNPAPKGTVRKPPKVQPGKADKLPLESWMRPHPFMRADDSNAIGTDQWLAFADKAFPGDIMFVGCLLVTELWLAAQVMPAELWVGWAEEVAATNTQAELRSLICATLTAMYKESKLPQKDVRTAVEKLWTFLRSLRFSSLDRTCQLASIELVSTKDSDEHGPSSDLFLTGFFKQQDLKAKTLCRQIPTVAQRVAGDAIERAADPPVGEAIKSICWLVFYGARCAISCTSYTIIDKCECPHHVRYILGKAHYDITPDDMLNLARSRALSFLEKDLKMPVNSKELGGLNKLGVAYVTKLVRRRSLSLASLVPSITPSVKKAAVIDPPEAVKSATRPVAVEANVSQEVKEDKEEKSTTAGSIETTGFVARPTKVSKPRPAVKFRKPIPVPPKKVETPTEPKATAEESSAKPSSAPVHDAATQPTVIKSILQSKPSSSNKHDRAIRQLSSRLLNPGPTFGTPKIPPTPRPPLPSSFHNGALLPSAPPPPSAVSILGPPPLRPKSDKEWEEEQNKAVFDSDLTELPLTVVKGYLERFSGLAEQSSGPAKRMLERLGERCAVHIVRRDGPMDKPSEKTGLTGPGYADCVDLHTSYHVFVGKSHQHCIPLQRSSKFEKLSEQWMAHIVSLKASLPGAVIPPSRYMFLWKGRPLKLSDTPAGVGMQWKEDIFVIDSMDAAMSLRTHEAGLCKEILRTIVFRDMLRMQQGLDPAPEGIALSREIATRFHNTPPPKQDECPAEGELKTKATSVDLPSATQKAQGQCKQAPSSPVTAAEDATSEQLTRILRDSPAQRLLTQVTNGENHHIISRPRHQRFGSVQIFEAPRPRPRPQSLQLAGGGSRPSLDLGAKAAAAQEANAKLPDSPLRPFKLVSHLKEGDTTKVDYSPVAPDTPVTPTKVKGFAPALLPSALSPPQKNLPGHYPAIKTPTLPRFSPRRPLLKPLVFESDGTAAPKSKSQLTFSRRSGPTCHSPTRPQPAVLSPPRQDTKIRRKIEPDMFSKPENNVTAPSTPKRHSLLHTSAPATPTVQHTRTNTLQSPWRESMTVRNITQVSQFDQPPGYYEPHHAHRAPAPRSQNNEGTLRKAFRYGWKGLFGE